ncbi:uncharacterized protein [Hemitrygon akajei]|uniref:uncharacterized protein isoform X2 n=1 Tax=Hemitrygon akajei TaxID=2704970 RepID=UPI003BFA2419
MAVPAQSHRDEPVTRSVIDSTACAERVAAIAAALDCGPWYPRRREDRQWHRDPGLGHGGSFALFLENCAPAVNSLNFGITNPLLLGSANLQLAQIKAQLTLQQLNSVASTTLSNTALASLNQALVKINMSMFNARGPFGQNQGPPNQFGQSQVPASQFGQMQRPTTQFGQNQGSASQYAMNAPGTYMAGGAGAAGRGMGLGAQGTSPGNYSGMNMGMMNQSGNNVGLGQWPSYQSPSSGGYRPGYGSATTSSSQSGDQRSAVQLFHDTMKASNILANFGLSNEDLEELSRYPDEKLTPENMPYILREIRMRKMNKQQSSSSYSQPYKLQDKDYRREAVQSSVVDYGHGQQYDYRDRPVESPSMRYSRETLREGTWNEDFKRPSQNYQMESSRDESSHGIKRSVKKGLPKPKLMNDYYGVPALRFPHVCSLCNIECRQMRDWERHKKTSVHYDSCRLLLKEYPDWDPDAVPPTKDDLAKKEKEAVATDQAATSFSSSRMSPKHLSPRRMSPHRTSPRRSSPRKFSPRRSSPRKVSPRRMSPHRSRSSPRRTSPHRSRGSPRRTSPHRSRSSPRRSSPHRSRPRRMSPHKSRTSPKHSSPQRSSPRKSNTKRKTQKELPTKNSNQKSPNQKAVKRAVTGKPHAEAKSNTGHMDNRAATYQRQIPLQYRDRSKTNLHKDLAELRDLGLLRGTGLQSSESPAAGIRRRRWRRRKRKRRQASASEEAEYPDAQDKASAQQMNEMRKSGRVVHVTDLPHDGYTEEDISKLTQPFGKVVGIKLVSSKNEAFLEMAYKEAAVAVVEFYSITPAEINRRQVSMTLLGQKKDVPKLDQSEQLESQAAAFEEKENTADTSAVPQTTMEATTPSSADAMKEDETAATQKTESENASPNDKGRVIRISNLPAKGYTEEDLKRLAKPFGEVLNVVITFSKNQAYLEMACKKAATKMVEFYRLSTIKLEGNAISMEILHQYVDLSDMEVIFKDMVEESGFKPDDGRSIYDHLVHISNLPEDGYTEVDILWVAFRFGRVKASMFLKPHNKALLHLENANAAISMCSFFREIPHDFHGKTLEFSLSPHAGILPENQGKEDQLPEESGDASKEPEPMETEPAEKAESTDDKKAQGTPSDKTTTESTKPDVTMASVPETDTVAATTTGPAPQNVVPTTAVEPPAASAGTPLTTKPPASFASGSVAGETVLTSGSTESGQAGKVVPVNRNAPSKPAVVAAEAMGKSSAVPAAGNVAKPAESCETKPINTTGQATSTTTKPPQDTEGATGPDAALKPAGKPSPVPGNTSTSTITTADSEVTLRPAPAPGKAVACPTSTVSEPSDATVEKASPVSGTVAPAGTPTAEGDTAPVSTLTPSAPPRTTNPSPSTTTPSNTTARQPKSMVVKPTGKESSATKSSEKRNAPPRREHAARETGKAGTPSRGRSASKEDSGRRSSSHQREKEFRSSRRHVSQFQRDRDRDYRSYMWSKTSSDRNSKDRRTSSRNPKREAEQEVFPFNLDEFVTVDEVGEEEDLAGDQIPETDTQTSESTELKLVGAESTEDDPNAKSAAATEQVEAVETTEVTSKPEATAQLEPQPEAKTAADEQPMETETEKAAEAPTAEPSKAPLPDTRPEAAALPVTETTVAQRGTTSPVSAGGEPARSAAAPPPSNLSPVPASSGGDATNAGQEQRAEPKMKRESPPEVEPAVKRIRLAGTNLTELKMPPYKPNSPVGVEFVVPKTGYFCQICSLFYTNEDTAKVTHCSTMLHYKNMEKYVNQRKEEIQRQQERVPKQEK